MYFIYFLKHIRLPTRTYYIVLFPDRLVLKELKSSIRIFYNHLVRVHICLETVIPIDDSGAKIGETKVSLKPQLKLFEFLFENLG